ncbi:MAG TPA: hypothetical protein DIC22_05435 [Chitinophagaceae bacterium]|nr:hypothetical protein [Chitinophagaceae bacterium]
MKLFPVYFLSVLIVELAGERLYHRHLHNTGLINVWGIIEFSFYFFVLREMVDNLKIRRIFLFGIIFYPLISFIVLYFQKQDGFSSINYSTGSLVTVTFCIYYYVDLFQRQETGSLATLPSFWIATGIFFNIICTFPMFALISFMRDVPALIAKNLAAILFIITLFSAILLSIGFLCRIRIKRSTL